MSHHKLLQAQLRKSARADGSLDHNKFVGLIDSAYHDSDRERRRSERSIDLMVRELGELNANLESLASRRADKLRGVLIAFNSTLQNTAQDIFVIDASGRVTSCKGRARRRQAVIGVIGIGLILIFSYCLARPDSLLVPTC